MLQKRGESHLHSSALKCKAVASVSRTMDNISNRDGSGEVRHLDTKTHLKLEIKIR